MVGSRPEATLADPRLRIGTSGYSYKEWRGAFYPEKLKEADMLAFYATRFDTVEINNTFYRMPASALLALWAEGTPDGFCFALKAPQRITHHKRLADVASEVSYFLGAASGLASKLGPVLYQMPPNLKKDLGRLRGFLETLPAHPRSAFEFRHESWIGPDTEAILAEGGAALCVADTDDHPIESFAATAPFGYLRLRRLAYSEDDLRRWLDRIRAQPWGDAYVFFKHEDEARGPEFAGTFAQKVSAR
jgi:uncharacterized protein YecE (DUF72 family)